MIKEERAESQEKTSERLANEKGEGDFKKGKKNRKKKRITKMTLK
jgi:hypothetical protein